MYVRQPGLGGAGRPTRCRPAYVLSSHKFYVDELYDYFLVRPMDGFAQFLRIIDQYVVDGLVDLIGQRSALSRQRCSGRSRTAWCSITPC